MQASKVERAHATQRGTVATYEADDDVDESHNTASAGIAAVAPSGHTSLLVHGVHIDVPTMNGARVLALQS